MAQGTLDASLLKTTLRAARAIRARDQLAALRSVSRLLEWATVFVYSDHPPGLARFESLLREVQLAGSAGLSGKLVARLAELRILWNHLRTDLRESAGATLTEAGEQAVGALERSDDPVARTMALDACAKVASEIRASHRTLDNR